MTRQRIGFIGLGIMGAPMCGHLIAAGHDLFVHTRSKVPIRRETPPLRISPRSPPRPASRISRTSRASSAAPTA